MGRPKKVEYTLKEKILRIKEAGLNLPEDSSSSQSKDKNVDDTIEDLPSRIKSILGIIQAKPIKATEMIYLVMYDIEDNKVRTLIAKYLLQKGCVRVQKSVYMAKTTPKVYQEIKESMRDIQDCYENNDSIILIPVPTNTPGSMEIIGKDVQIDILRDNPNTLFF